MNNPTKVIKDYTLLVATGIHIKLYIYTFIYLPALPSLYSFIPSFIYIPLKRLIIFFGYIIIKKLCNIILGK